MIQTKNDLKHYLQEDLKRNQLKYPILQKISYSENYRIYRYIKILRHYEYYYNNRIWYNIIPYLYYKLLYRRNIVKTNIFIYPNTYGPGLQIMHPGFRRSNLMVHAGKNCTLLPMILLGKKRPGITGNINIGDNCYISTGVTILGPVNIGNNVTIAAGAVVLHDIPDNCVVGGIPAKILKYKQNEGIK